jgi:hypothetical protein
LRELRRGYLSVAVASVQTDELASVALDRAIALGVVDYVIGRTKSCRATRRRATRN